METQKKRRARFRVQVKRSVLSRRCPVCTANRGESCGYDYAATRKDGWVPGKNEQSFVHVERL